MPRHKTRSLLEVWTRVLETPEPEEGKPCLVLHTASERVAKNLRLELYRYRSKSRALSKRGLQPTDMNYDTSPWDKYRIEQHGAELRIFPDSEVSNEFEIEVPSEIVEKARRRRSHKKED